MHGLGWGLLDVDCYQDSLCACRGLGDLGIFAGLGYGVAETTANFGEVKIADNGLAAALLDQQHAAFAGLLIGYHGGDEPEAIGAVDDDAGRRSEGLHVESVVARGERGTLPLDFMWESKAALDGALSGDGDRACANGRQRENCDDKHAIPNRFHGDLLAITCNWLRPLSFDLGTHAGRDAFHGPGREAGREVRRLERQEIEGQEDMKCGLSVLRRLVALREAFVPIRPDRRLSIQIERTATQYRRARPRGIGWHALLEGGHDGEKQTQARGGENRQGDREGGSQGASSGESRVGG